MKIAIDTSPLSSGHAGRGIGQYTRLLIDALKKYDTENSYFSVDYKLQTTNYKPDLLHYPFFDLFFLTLPIVKKVPTIVTIHDVIPLVFPKAYPSGTRGHLKFLIQKLSLSTVNHIVTDSECSTKDVHKLLTPKAPVSTVYLAPDPNLKPSTSAQIKMVKESFNLKNPYFLYVGDINYNKNIPALLKAVSSLDNHYTLVIVSKAFKRDNPAAKELWQLVDELNIEPKLRVVSNLNETESLATLYSGANWYIQPSLYEGFGLPVLEAQACGCPVITSTGGSLSEIIKDSAISFEPHEPLALENAIHKAVSLSDRTDFIEKGFTNTKRFSWEKTARQMVRIYETI